MLHIFCGINSRFDTAMVIDIRRRGDAKSSNHSTGLNPERIFGLRILQLFLLVTTF